MWGDLFHCYSSQVFSLSSSIFIFLPITIHSMVQNRFIFFLNGLKSCSYSEVIGVICGEVQIRCYMTAFSEELLDSIYKHKTLLRQRMKDKEKHWT